MLCFKKNKYSYSLHSLWLAFYFSLMPKCFMAIQFWCPHLRFYWLCNWQIQLCILEAYSLNNVLTCIVKWSLQARHYHNPFLLPCRFSKLTSNEQYIRITSALPCYTLIRDLVIWQPKVRTQWVHVYTSPTPPPTPNDYSSIHCLCEFSFSSFCIVLRSCDVWLFVPQQFPLV